MTTERNTVLPDDVAREFGLELAKLSGSHLPDLNHDVLMSLGRIAFKRSLEIAEQIDFGEDVT